MASETSLEPQWPFGESFVAHCSASASQGGVNVNEDDHKQVQEGADDAQQSQDRLLLLLLALECPDLLKGDGRGAHGLGACPARQCCHLSGIKKEGRGDHVNRWALQARDPTSDDDTEAQSPLLR